MRLRRAQSLSLPRVSDLCEADNGRIFRAPPGEMESLHFSEKAGHIAATKLTHRTLCIGHAKG